MFFSKHKPDRLHACLPAACAVSGVAAVWSLHDTLGLASGALLIETDPASAPTDPRLPADLATVLHAYRRYRGGRRSGATGAGSRAKPGENRGRHAARRSRERSRPRRLELRLRHEATPP